jgi:hypothetical protein
MTINPNAQINVTIGTGTTIQTTITGGARGLSAYEVWLEQGHTGTADDFLNWLRADSYTYVQSSASTTWTITHNLNTYPSVTVVDSSGSVVSGDVQYLSENSLRITFSAQFAGKAYLN